MSTLQKVSLVLLGSAVVLAGANPASAQITLQNGGTAVLNQGQFSSVSGATTINFENPLIPGGFATYSSPAGTTPIIVQGSKAGEYATPAGDTTKYLTISPTTSKVTGNTGSVTINFAKALDYFGLYWGSVDTYNFIDFYTGGSLLQTFNGTQVPGTKASGNWTDPKDNVFVNFFANNGVTFDKIVLRSTSPAFETDNHAYRVASVPEPGSILSLLAFGAVSAGSFVKCKSKLA